MDPSVTDPAACNQPEKSNYTKPATNPNPCNGHSYPSYPEMINAAIGALREKDGSSRQAIAKYMEQTFTNLPADNAGLLTRHLKLMKQAGQLVMVKHSYALPVSASDISESASIGNETVVVRPDTTATAAKRRPGRPPKLKAENLQLIVSPLVPVQEPVFVSLGLKDEPVKRSRGRPPKLKSLTFSTDQVAPTEHQPDPTGQSESKRKKGRPRKIENVARIIPKLAKKLPKPNGTRRGRPRKYIILPAVSIAEAKTAVGVTPVKRRSLSTGSSGLKKARKLSGKPLGRPRKILLIGAPSADQQIQATEELVQKLEHIQAKIKEVVNIVKPYLGTTTTTNALRALHELEQLAWQNLYAPLNLTSSQEQPVLVQPPAHFSVPSPVPIAESSHLKARLKVSNLLR